MKRILAFTLTVAMLVGLCVIGVSAVPGNLTTTWTAWNPTPVNMKDAGESVGFRAVITNTWYGVGIYSGSYDSVDDGQYTVSVFAWAGTYEATVATDPVFATVVHEQADNGYWNVEFTTPLAAGDYLVLCDNGSDSGYGVGVFLQAGATTGVQTYRKGAKDNNNSFFGVIYAGGGDGNGFVKEPLTEQAAPEIASPYTAVSGTKTFLGDGENPWLSGIITGNFVANTSTVGLRVLPAATWNGFSVYTSSTDTENNRGYILSVYEWDTDYATTIGKTALRQGKVNGITNGKEVNFAFGETLPAGDYLIVISDVFTAQNGESVSLWTVKPSGTKAASYFLDGVEQPDKMIWAFVFTGAANAASGLYNKAFTIPAVANPAAAPAGGQVKLFTGWLKNRVNLETQTAGLRVTPTSNWYGIGTYALTTGAEGGFVASVYPWNTDYATSLTGNPVVQKRFHFAEQASVYSYLTFDNPLPADEYLVVYDRGYIGGSVYTAAPDTAAFPYANATAYIDGVAIADTMMPMLFETGLDQTSGIGSTENLLNYYGYQKSTDEGDTFHLRLIATGNNTDIAKVGFSVRVTNIENKAWDENTRYVYETILAQSGDGKTLQEITSASCGAAYLASITIRNIPVGTEADILVTPYIIQMDETRVPGVTYRITVAADGTITQGAA